MNRVGHWMSMGIVLFVLAGCLPLQLPLTPQPTVVPIEEPSSPTPTAQQTPDAPSSTPIPKEEETVPAIDYSTIPQVQQAMADLTSRLGIDASAITVVHVKEVTWPDGSLGCPQPGVVYPQVVQDGLLIRLGIGREMYFYHSGGDQEPFLCKQTSELIPNVTPKSDEMVPPPGSEID